MLSIELLHQGLLLRWGSIFVTYTNGPAYTVLHVIFLVLYILLCETHHASGSLQIKSLYLPALLDEEKTSYDEKDKIF